ncbi:MAG TPA: methyltransferase domain-containing protein [Propionicimonas sp.]|jgi:SAM-dependent methyltransferase|nr:methyltransferase domain-containing protein [Propionicimonas sp.]
MTEPAEFWEARYSGSDGVWSGRVNPTMAEVAADLPPGRALDLGCGEGGDVLWLAERGWQVTGVDISPTAVARGRAAAAAAGLPEGQVRFVADDLASFAADGEYDLVTACFLQSPVELNRSGALVRAAARIAPGGHLLVVTHAAPPPWASALNHEHHPQQFLSPEQEIAALALSDTDWQTVRAEIRTRSATGPDGRSADLHDAVVLLRRR